MERREEQHAADTAGSQADRDAELVALRAEHVVGTEVHQAEHDAEVAPLQAHIANLNNALDSRTVIGLAMGLLMPHTKVDAEGAFDLLPRASQRMNRKLRDIAVEIVDTHTERLTSS